jgi:outer membrane protein
VKHATFAAAVLVAAALLAPAARAEEPLRLGFTETVAIATSKNPNVTIAELRRREAEARIQQSRAAFLPTLTGYATMTDRTYNINALGFRIPSMPGVTATDPLIGPVYDSEARVKVTQTLFDASSWQKLQGSKLGALAARADLGGTAESAAQSAGLAYLRAARAEAVVTAREQDLKIAEELQALAEAQLEAGTAPSIDATRARTAAATARGALLVARNARDRSRIDLARVLGMDPAVPPVITDTLDAGLGQSEAPAEVAPAVEFALQHRDELRGEQARLARARADRSATSYERIPRLDVSGDWGASGEHYSDALGTYTYAAALTVPLVDGWRREGRLKEQADVIRESEVREKDLRDQITAEVSGALLDLAAGLEQQVVAGERLRLAQEELDQARDRFVSGVAGNIEVITAQASLLRARDADIDARFAVSSARVALARAAGVARGMR